MPAKQTKVVLVATGTASFTKAGALKLHIKLTGPVAGCSPLRAG